MNEVSSIESGLAPANKFPMANYDVIQDTNSYHGIQTIYGMPGMPKNECAKCDKAIKCAKLAPWIKLCEDVNNVVIKQQTD